jgi:hypothetical protein
MRAIRYSPLYEIGDAIAPASQMTTVEHLGFADGIHEEDGSEMTKGGFEVARDVRPLEAVDVREP